MKGFCPLASGSKGNCIYLASSSTKILIDAGISARMAQKKLAEIGVDIADIDAIIVTHEHTDHIQGLATISTKFDIPIFANSDTAKAISSALRFYGRFKIFSTGEMFEFGQMQIYPFSVQHDAMDPVGLTFYLESTKIGICTDLGFASSSVVKSLEGCDYLYIEANHEPSMVHACSRPMIYKQRVLSRQGHLSNEQCGELLAQIDHSALKKVYLAHLSSECNAPEVALRIVQSKVKRPLNLAIAYQDQISEPLYFTLAEV